MEAVLVSAGLPGAVLVPGAAGQVHSVFAQACNLEIGGSLVTLAAPELGPGPHAMLVPPGPGGFPARGLAAGQPVRVLDGALAAGPLRIMWQSAPRWAPVPAPPPVVGGAADLAANGAGLAGALGACGRHEGLVPGALAVWRREAAAPGATGGPDGAEQADGRDGTPQAADIRTVVARRARGGALTLAAAALAGDAAAVAAAAVKLVGLGPGFTPAGDDYLAGMTAALVLAGRWGAPAGGGGSATGPAGGPGPAATAAAAALAAACTAVTPRATGLVSRAMLGAAAAGELPAAAGSVIGWLLGPAAPAPDALDRLLQIGHSSGADTAGGFLSALRLLVPDAIP